MESSIDITSLQAAWQDLNKLLPLGPIKGEKDYKRRVQIMDELLDRIGANESHRLMSLLNFVTTEIETYAAKHHALPEAAPSTVLAYLMEEHQLKQSDLAEGLGGTKHRVRELHQVKQERDFLKEAVAYFAKKSK